MGGKKESYRPAYQNTVKFYHNPHSALTKKIMTIEHDCLCDRCLAIIDWRKTYRKYKPIKEPRRCNTCLNKAITRAYHTICEPCAREKGICAKCNLPCESSLRPKKVSDEEVMNVLNNSGIKERLKRSMLRNWENGLLSSEDVVTVVTADANGNSIDWTKLLVTEDGDLSDDDAKDMGVESRPKKTVSQPKTTVVKSTPAPATEATSAPVVETEDAAKKQPTKVKVTKSVKVIKTSKSGTTTVEKKSDQPKVLRGKEAQHGATAVAITQMQAEFKLDK